MFSGTIKHIKSLSPYARSLRKPFRDLALQLGCPSRILHIRAEEATLRARLRERLAQGRDPSEADEAVLEAQLEKAEPPSGEETRFVETISTDP